MALMEKAAIPAVDLRREAIEDSRRLTFAQKFRLGGDLFDYACQVTKAGIRWQNPEFSEEQVLNELRRRVHLGEKIRERLP
jgi:hypothetical protein